MFDRLRREGIQSNVVRQIRLYFYQATIRRGISLRDHRFSVP